MTPVSTVVPSNAVSDPLGGISIPNESCAGEINEKLVVCVAEQNVSRKRMLKDALVAERAAKSRARRRRINKQKVRLRLACAGRRLAARTNGAYIRTPAETLLPVIIDNSPIILNKMRTT